MRIKEVCERTGLTDRAIRLYMENGLVAPRQEYNYMGRRSISFDEEDIRVLEDVATLRQAGFSIADIRLMLESPLNISKAVRVREEELEKEIKHLKHIKE